MQCFDQTCPILQHWLIDFSLLCTGTPLVLPPSVAMETSTELFPCPSDRFNSLKTTRLISASYLYIECQMWYSALSSSSSICVDVIIELCCAFTVSSFLCMNTQLRDLVITYSVKYRLTATSVCKLFLRLNSRHHTGLNTPTVHSLSLFVTGRIHSVGHFSVLPLCFMGGILLLYQLLLK